MQYVDLINPVIARYRFNMLSFVFVAVEANRL